MGRCGEKLKIVYWEYKKNFLFVRKNCFKTFAIKYHVVGSISACSHLDLNSSREILKSYWIQKIESLNKIYVLEHSNLLA